MREDSSNQTGHSSLIRQSGQILAGTNEFVPTSSDRQAGDPVDWQTAIRRSVRSSNQLRQILGLNEDQGLRENDFPTFVPWEYIARIRPGDQDDPLLRQVLLSADESIDADGFSADPVGDLEALAAGGVLHKYESRALVIATGACGVHCRYCFRRDFPYVDAGSRRQNWQPAIDYISNDETIDEVILSGGDPLTLVDDQLDGLVAAIEQIPHVRRLRIHSRMPIVIPQRVTKALVTRLSGSRLTTWIVVHANHPNELDEAVLDRVGLLIDAGIPVLNQAVLLRAVNDDAQTLIELCRTLVDHRIQPYYLHQLDRVRGAAHFEVPISRGNEIMSQLRRALPGYAVPTYVVEQSGESSKIPIGIETEVAATL
jgi:EF-P beta-lysylation protein EpmB